MKTVDLSQTPQREQEGPILHLGKKLVPIDEYSKRTGLSAGLLEQYGRIGIVQLRRFKGETFVVDVPSRMRFSDAETKAVKELIDAHNRACQTKKLTKLVAKITSSPKEIKEVLPEQVPDLKLFETGAQAYRPVEKISIVKRFGLDSLLAKIQTSQLTQVAAVFAVTFILVSIYASFWVLIAGEIQAGRFARARSTIQEMITESERAEQKIENVQNQLDNSLLQAGILNAEITVAVSELEAIRRQDEAAIEKLDKRFSQLKLLK